MTKQTKNPPTSLFGKADIKFSLTKKQREKLKPLVDQLVSSPDGATIMAQIIVYVNQYGDYYVNDVLAGVIEYEVTQKLEQVFGFTIPLIPIDETW